VINSLKNLQLVSAQELRFDKQKWQELLNPICSLWQNIYKKEDYSQVRISKKDQESQDPVDQFVFMEVQAVLAILRKVNDSVMSIIGVLNGSEMLTPTIEMEATALLKNTVPATWEKDWDGGPENPSNWMRTITRKGLA
jgi:dynein heavy chain 2, cytosolic